MSANMLIRPCGITDARLMLREGCYAAEVRLYFPLLAQTLSDCVGKRQNKANSAEGASGDAQCISHSPLIHSPQQLAALAGLRHVRAPERLETSWANQCQLPKKYFLLARLI